MRKPWWTEREEASSVKFLPSVNLIRYNVYYAYLVRTSEKKARI